MIKTIVRWPSNILKKPCQKVESLDKVQQLITDLKDTLNTSGGLGLAANQIGESLAVLAIQSSNQGTKVFINPKIMKTGDWTDSLEGCLSIPGVMDTIRRAQIVVVEYMNGAGFVSNEVFEGRDAQVLQHEIDHLNGKVFIDYLPPGKRDLIRNVMRKMRR